MTVRPEVVALLTDFDVERTGAQPRFAHRDGRPFTEEEADLVTSATDEEVRAAAGELAGAPQRLAELLMPYLGTAARERGERPPDGSGNAPGG
jgi:hypothetical protein